MFFSFRFRFCGFEQLSDSGVSQSKKLVELAEATERLKQTREALERAERLVFEQRQEGIL